MAKTLIKKNTHSWNYGRCVNCGIERETVKINNSFVTVYKDPQTGRILLKPKCSGSFVVRNIILTLLIFLSSLMPAQIKLSDDTKHVYAGFLITAVSGSITFDLTERLNLTMSLAPLSGITAGAAKELIYDGYFNKGVQSNKDFYNTVWGSFIGTISLRVYINVKHKK